MEEKLKRLLRATSYLIEIEKISITSPQKDIAKEMGRNYTNVNSAFNGKKEYLTDSFLKNLNKTFGGIFHESWLLTGEGDMLKTIEAEEIPLDKDKGDFFVENSNGAKFYDLHNGQYRVNVPFVPYFAYGRFANAASTLELDKDDWDSDNFTVKQIIHGNYLSFEVKGDSMDNGSRDSFEEGDRILVREVDKMYWKDGLRYNKFPYWVIVFDSSVLIKQIIDQDMETGEITCHSLSPSPQYSDFKLKLDEVRRLYNVVQKKPRSINY